MAEYNIAAARKEMERWHWWGIPTFFRCPWREDPAQSDIALLGVPHSSGNGATQRDQHLGPRAVRVVSALFRRDHLPFGIVPWDICRISDAGDVPMPEAMNNDVTVGHIEAYAKLFDRAGTRVVAMGGDHSITGPLVKAVSGPGSNLSGGRKVALVQFDAHTDTFSHIPHWLGNVRSAAHWASYLVEEGHVDSGRSTQIGIRPNVGSPQSLGVSAELGYRIIGMDELDEIGTNGTIEALRERIGDAPVYITFDLDALDPADAPGVAAVEPGSFGIRVGQAVKILQGLRGLDIVGADVVCFVPTKDNPNQITAMNANAIMFELVSLIADRIGRS